MSERNSCIFSLLPATFNAPPCHEPVVDADALLQEVVLHDLGGAVPVEQFEAELRAQHQHGAALHRAPLGAGQRHGLGGALGKGGTGKS